MSRDYPVVVANRPARCTSNIIIHGVYKVPWELTQWAARGLEEPREISVEQSARLYGVVPEFFANLWLIELTIHRLDREFDGLDYAQEDPSKPGRKWQVAYDERFLDQEGRKEILPAIGKSVRVVFYFHFLDFHRPLLTAYGNVPLPAATAFPERLRGLLHYDLP